MHKLEIEKRFIIDPTSWLALSERFKIFRQAQLWSGKAWVIIPDFYARIAEIFNNTESARFRAEADAKLSMINTKQGIKIRVRHILDPYENTVRAQVTIKEKLLNQNGYKRYVEYDIYIPASLALLLIEQIAQWHMVPTIPTHGILKHRYIVAGPDGKLWDIDILQGSNTGVYLGEIEVGDTIESFENPSWAVKDITGLPQYKYLGTKELQEHPASIWTPKERKLYFEVIAWSRWKK